MTDIIASFTFQMTPELKDYFIRHLHQHIRTSSIIIYLRQIKQDMKDAGFKVEHHLTHNKKLTPLQKEDIRHQTRVEFSKRFIKYMTCSEFIENSSHLTPVAFKFIIDNHLPNLIKLV